MMQDRTPGQATPPKLKLMLSEAEIQDRCNVIVMVAYDSMTADQFAKALAFATMPRDAALADGRVQRTEP